MNGVTGGAGGAGGSGGYASGGGNGGPGGAGGAGQGGGLFLMAGTLGLTGCTLDHNAAHGGTGGLGGYGNLGFTTGFSGVGGNGGAGGAALGGGLFAAGGQVTLTNDTFALNAVGGGTGGMGGTEGYMTGFGSGGAGGAGGASQGGGLYLGAGTLQLTNATLAQNQAADSQGGKGVSGGHNGRGSKGQGGGVDNAAGTANALNTIIATNHASQAPDFSGNFATATFNLLGDNAGSNLTAGNGNLVGTPQNPINPMLAPLGNYGGPTQTMALLAGSPAIDAGTSASAPAKDQRGVVRGSPPDMGAFENTTSSRVFLPPASAASAGSATAGGPALTGAAGLALLVAADPGSGSLDDGTVSSRALVGASAGPGRPGLVWADLDRLFAFAFDPPGSWSTGTW
jgi:hypothetical protein